MANPTYPALKALVDSNSGTNTGDQDLTALNAHVASTSNPHGVTKAQVGLGSVDNTSDAAKPVSSATQTALDGKLDSTFTKAQLDTAVTDGNVLFVGDAPTAHTHPSTDISDSTAAGRALLTTADATAQRTALGLGTLATQSGTFSGTSSGTNTGDQTSIVGITGTKAQFDTAVTDGNIMYIGDAPTAHNHAATEITSGTLDGDRLPGLSTTKKGGVPATGTPSGLFLKDDGTWAAASGGGGGANLAIGTVTSTTVQITSDTGTAATIPAATTTAAGLLVAADFGKVARVRSVILDMVYTTLPALTGTHTTDGYTCTAGDTVGVAVQAGSVSNGIWTVNAGAWTRPTWANTDALLRPLTMVCKPNGSNSAGAEFQITNTSAITVGSTSITVTKPRSFDTQVAGELSINRYGTAAACSMVLYGNGGATAGATIARTSGANGNLDFSNLGSGSTNLSQNGQNCMSFSSAQLTLGSSQAAYILKIGAAAQTTGNIDIGQQLTTGVITLGGATPTVGTAANTALKGATKSENGIAWGDNRITSGTSSTITAKQASVLFDAGSAIASYTLTLPASTLIVDGQELLIHAGEFGVIALTITAGSGTTIRGAIAALATDSFARWKYNTATTTWMRIG